jgi:ATP-dependent helicase/DNAse subunit B
MKKIKTLALSMGLALFAAGCVGGPSVPSETKDTCSVEKNGIDKVLATAKKYNAIAIEHDVEFRRLDVNNRDLIISVEEAIKTGATEVNPMDFKGKPSKTKLKTDYAAWRACSFAIAALQQEAEAKDAWRLAIPGDGFQY